MTRLRGVVLASTLLLLAVPAWAQDDAGLDPRWMPARNDPAAAERALEEAERLLRVVAENTDITEPADFRRAWSNAGRRVTRLPRDGASDALRERFQRLTIDATLQPVSIGAEEVLLDPARLPPRLDASPAARVADLERRMAALRGSCWTTGEGLAFEAAWREAAKRVLALPRDAAPDGLDQRLAQVTLEAALLESPRIGGPLFRGTRHWHVLPPLLGLPEFPTDLRLPLAAETVFWPPPGGTPAQVRDWTDRSRRTIEALQGEPALRPLIPLLVAAHDRRALRLYGEGGATLLAGTLEGEPTAPAPAKGLADVLGEVR